MAIGEVEERLHCFGLPSPKRLLEANHVDNSALSSSNQYSLKSFLAPYPRQQLSSEILTSSQPTECDGASAAASVSNTFPLSSGNTKSFRNLGDGQTGTESAIEASYSALSINELLKTKPALDAIEMGFSQEEVQTVIQQKVGGNGESYLTVGELVEAVLAYQTAANSIDDQEGRSTTSSPTFNRQTISEDDPMVQHEEKTMQKQQKVKSKSKVRSPRIEKSSDKTLHRGGSDLCVDGHFSATDSMKKLSPLTVKEENTKLKSSRLCKICQENEPRVVFLPCGHLVSCADCSLLIMKCTICNQDVKGSVKVFLA